jgi:hypothetical protein
MGIRPAAAGGQAVEFTSSMPTKRQAIAIINRDHVLIWSWPLPRRMEFSEATGVAGAYVAGENARGDGWAIAEIGTQIEALAKPINGQRGKSKRHGGASVRRHMPTMCGFASTAFVILLTKQRGGQR